MSGQGFLPVLWADRAFADAAPFRTTEAPQAQHLRQEGIAALQAAGIPTTKREEWKYTNVSTLASRDWTPFPACELQRPTSHAVFPDSAGDIVFLNGHYQPQLSRLPQGVDLEIYAQSSAGSDFFEPFGTLAKANDFPFVALNSALFVAPVRVVVTESIEQPIQFLFLTDATEQSGISSPRLSIGVGDGVTCSFVENYHSVSAVSSHEYFTNAVTEIELGKDARCEHTKIQDEDLNAYHCASLWLRQPDRSHFTSNVFHFGGKVVRNEIHPLIAGSEAELHLNGLTVLTGNQHVDNFTVIDHAMPNSFSREIYKGIYDDKSSGAFSGTIIVRKDAQKTNAIQSNQSILLSGDAKSDSRPQLKIWADDVKCTHGATVGQLDEHGLFYLRSRGIPKEQARNLLLRAFASEVIYHFEAKATRDLLEALLLQKLAGRIE